MLMEEWSISFKTLLRYTLSGELHMFKCIHFDEFGHKHTPVIITIKCNKHIR